MSLNQLRSQAKKNQDNKLAKVQEKPTEIKERPLAKVFDFLQNRQENRLAILFSMFNKNQIIEEPKSLPAPKTEVNYIG